VSVDFVREELLDAGLHEESVEDLLEHYRKMRSHLSSENHVEAGAHVGDFCESMSNIIRAETGEGVDPHIQAGRFLDNILNGNLPKNGLEDSVYTTIPRAMRVAYDLRNNRDSVHVNLKVEVNHSDTQTAVRLCTWILAELVRVYSDEDHLDDVAEIIEEFAEPMTTEMGLAERVSDRMVVDTESRLEEHFEEVNHLFQILGNGSILIEEEFSDASCQEKILIHLIGRRYAFEGDEVKSPTLPYGYFYSRFDIDKSSIRHHMNGLENDLMVEKENESGEWGIIPAKIGEALNRIEP